MTLNKILLLTSLVMLYSLILVPYFALARSTKLREQMFSVIKFKNYYKEVGD